jgi:predicted TIM-barrel fold metal-dependent hydrolase
VSEYGLYGIEEGQAVTTGIFDVDSHISEPDDLWTSRVSQKWGDAVPHVKWTETSAWEGAGEEAWFIGDDKLAPAWGTAFSGSDYQFPEYPRIKSEANPAAWDPIARAKVLDQSGIDFQVLYPNLGGFGNEGFLRLKDPSLMLECVQAYNDFLAEFASSSPGRFAPICAVPFWDLDATVVEVRRAHEMGHQGVLFSGAPHEVGFPRLVDPHWEPLWAAVEELGIPFSFHLGSGDITRSFSPEIVKIEGLSPTYARSSQDMFLEVGKQLNSLLFSQILVRHPNLKFVCVESGIGYIPFLLESADYHYERGGVRRDHPEFSEPPSFYFRRQCAATFWFETLTDDLVERIGADNIMFETDFPHPTGLWRDEVGEHVERSLRNKSGEIRNKVLRENAIRFYGLPR